MTALAQVETHRDDADLPALIILGRDDAHKSHAAWFDQSEAAAATSAAALMAMMALPVISDELRALAGRLPHGKIFSGSGRAFVPFVKGSTYDVLISHVPADQRVQPLRLVRAEADGGEKPSEPTASPLSKEPPHSLPTDWDGIIPGSVVLATVTPDEGWWEAVVLEARPGNMWQLRWLQYPTEPVFTRQASNLALLHPSHSLSA